MSRLVSVLKLRVSEIQYLHLRPDHLKLRFPGPPLLAGFRSAASIPCAAGPDSQIGISVELFLHAESSSIREQPRKFFQVSSVPMRGLPQQLASAPTHATTAKLPLCTSKYYVVLCCSFYL